MSAETSVKGMDSILLQIDAKKIFEDKEFLEKLSKAKTPEEIIELFKTKEIILSLEQVQEIVKRGEKLAEADLENVSGGMQSDGSQIIDNLRDGAVGVWNEFKKHPLRYTAEFAIGASMLTALTCQHVSIKQLTKDTGDLQDRVKKLEGKNNTK